MAIQTQHHHHVGHDRSPDWGLSMDHRLQSQASNNFSHPVIQVYLQSHPTSIRGAPAPLSSLSQQDQVPRVLPIFAKPRIIYSQLSFDAITLKTLGFQYITPLLPLLHFTCPTSVDLPGLNPQTSVCTHPRCSESFQDFTIYMSPHPHFIDI